MASLRFILCCVLVNCACATIVSHDGRAITIDGHRRVLLSGSIHYPRSTPEVFKIPYIKHYESLILLCLLLIIFVLLICLDVARSYKKG